MGEVNVGWRFSREKFYCPDKKKLKLYKLDPGKKLPFSNTEISVKIMKRTVLSTFGALSAVGASADKV